MLSIEDMQKLKAVYDPHQPAAQEQVLHEIGDPTAEEIIAVALEGLKSADRNVRVLMLRVLKGQSGEQAAQGILAGLRDEKRRVREVAIKSCRAYLRHPEIIEQLERMATDEGETAKIRNAALQALAGHGVGPSLRKLPLAAAKALNTLLDNEKYRETILFNLLLLDLSEQVESLLREFVKNGTREEAVMATKALCGFQVVNLGSFNEETASAITQTCERAAGRVFYWVKRAELDRYRTADA